ncbi:methionine ABC transporter ATP-binding protein [Lactimicrobium sp.]|jgi:D-methionine transport system ATP-binding protein|uniref:methionine ABC transporter ATP-binding protein n=1 Tax=Lactimicrobium sp. TaxID=2563780 RepID=UPI002F359592
MIEIGHLSKTYDLNKAQVHAVNDVSLRIEKGEVYGVIGYSGAGKSTLVRCINFLEKPQAGTIHIDGFGTVYAGKQGLQLEKDGKQAQLKEKDLRQLRRSIGMIFQHFNLLDRSTVFDNVAYPLRYRHLSKKQIEERVDHLLELVNLSEKKNAYPSQLSGGQKQRVAIARALADEPDVLLCDEATSALDPDATESILALLKQLNKELGLTLVVITHEMAVIKEIADKVAVMENGKIVEEGSVYDIFASPKQPITRKFVESSSGLNKIGTLLQHQDSIDLSSPDSKLVKLVFTRESVGDALISQISRDYNVDVSIVLANVDLVEESALGAIIANIKGTKENVENALAYLESRSVRVEGVKA